MAAVQRIASIVPPAFDVGSARVEFAGGEEEWLGFFLQRVGARGPAIKEAEHGGSSVELAVSDLEGRTGEEAKLELASERSTHKPRGLVGREAEEDLLGKLVRQRRCWAGAEPGFGDREGETTIIAFQVYCITTSHIK